jgi:hypothetical protein
MKAVLYHHRGNEDFLRVFDMVKEFATIIQDPVELDKKNKDIDHIHIIYNGVVYMFNRFNKDFISKVEEAIATSPYPQYEGPLTIINIDDRFTNKKYYTITKTFRYEQFEVNKDVIIDDLYSSLNNNSNKRVRQGFDFDI